MGKLSIFSRKSVKKWSKNGSKMPKIDQKTGLEWVHWWLQWETVGTRSPDPYHGAPPGIDRPPRTPYPGYPPPPHVTVLHSRCASQRSAVVRQASFGYNVSGKITKMVENHHHDTTSDTTSDTTGFSLKIHFVLLHFYPG